MFYTGVFQEDIFLLSWFLPFLVLDTTILSVKVIGINVKYIYYSIYIHNKG